MRILGKSISNPERPFVNWAEINRSFKWNSGGPKPEQTIHHGWLIAGSFVTADCHGLD